MHLTEESKLSSKSMQDLLLKCGNYEIEFSYRMMLFKEEFCLFAQGSDMLDSWCSLKAYSFLCLLTPLSHSLFLGITSPPSNHHPGGPKCPQNRLGQTKSVNIGVTGSKNSYPKGIRVIFIFAQDAS